MKGFAGIQGVPKKMRHLFSLISLSVLILQDYAIYRQLEDVLPVVLHIGSGLSNERFSRYSGYAFNYQILDQIHSTHNLDSFYT